MMGWYGGYGWTGWLLMTVMMLGFWALLVLGGLALWRGLRGSGGATGPRDTDAVELLDERFARGEIDAEEYRTRRELLRSRR